jgi:predicted dinucleotide-binding enzyme
MLIDRTNRLAPGLSGLVLGTTISTGEEIARLATGAKVVDVFNIGAANFENPPLRAERASMFICGEEADAKTWWPTWGIRASVMPSAKYSCSRSCEVS